MKKSPSVSELTEQLLEREGVLGRARAQVLELQNQVEKLITQIEEEYLNNGFLVMRLEKYGWSTGTRNLIFRRQLIRRVKLSPDSDASDDKVVDVRHFQYDAMFPKTVEIWGRLSALTQSGEFQSPKAMFSFAGCWDTVSDDFVIFRGKKYSVLKLKTGT